MGNVGKKKSRKKDIVDFFSYYYIENQKNLIRSYKERKQKTNDKFS